MVLWLLLAASLGATIGLFTASLLAAGARADTELELVREQCKARLAHQVGDMMCAELAEELRRKDIKVKTRHRIGDLLYRWGALRPVTTTSAMTANIILTHKTDIGTLTEEPEFVGAPAPENGQRTGTEPCVKEGV